MEKLVAEVGVIGFDLLCRKILICACVYQYLYIRRVVLHSA